MVRLLKATKGDVFTFYLADPIWTDELRLVFWQNVDHPEAMYGFLPPSAAKVVAAPASDPVSILLCSKAQTKTSPLRNLKATPRGAPRSTRRLFGDFVERERVASAIRLSSHIAGSGKPAAVLFVSFRKKRVLRKTSAVVKAAKNLFMALFTQSTVISERILERDSAATMREVAAVFAPIRAVAQGGDETSVGRMAYFNDVLERALAATGVAQTDGLATIHLLEDDLDTLTLAASRGDIGNRQRAASLRISSGKGLISWVALRETALLIDNIKRSDFGAVYVEIRPSTRSQLTVPIHANNRLVGVLSLESRRANAFPPRMVRAVWYAANQAAVAYLLSESARNNLEDKRFVDHVLAACAKAVSGNHQAALDDCANLANGRLGAAVDILPFDFETKRFGAGGASYSTPDKPRENGYTEMARREGVPILLEAPEGENAPPRVRAWRKGQWADVQTSPGIPIHPMAARAEWLIHLAVPSVAQDRCNGVVWLRYTSALIPSVAEMKSVLGLVDYCTLVLDCMHRDVELPSHRAVRAHGTQIAGLLFQNGPLDVRGFGWVAGHVIQRPHGGSIGGDFFGTVAIDADNLGVIVGDAQGSGVVGALNMLPLVSAFRACAADSRSPVPVLERLNETAQGIATTCAVTYCVLTRFKDKRWLTVSAAGDVTLVLARSGAQPSSLPSRHDLWPKTTFLGTGLTTPLMQESIELRAGDVMILVTDGIVDALDMRGSEVALGDVVFGLRRGRASTMEIAAEISKRAKAGNAVKPDDETILVMEVLDA